MSNESSNNGCCVPNCKNNHGQLSPNQLISFPSRRDRQIEWIDALELPSLMGLSPITLLHYKLCPAHFDPKYICIRNTCKGITTVTRNAIPTLHLDSASQACSRQIPTSTRMSTRNHILTSIHKQLTNNPDFITFKRNEGHCSICNKLMLPTDGSMISEKQNSQLFKTLRTSFNIEFPESITTGSHFPCTFCVDQVQMLSEIQVLLNETKAKLDSFHGRLMEILLAAYQREVSDHGVELECLMEDWKLKLEACSIKTRLERNSKLKNIVLGHATDKSHPQPSVSENLASAEELENIVKTKIESDEIVEDGSDGNDNSLEPEDDVILEKFAIDSSQPSLIEIQETPNVKKSHREQLIRPQQTKYKFNRQVRVLISPLRIENIISDPNRLNRKRLRISSIKHKRIRKPRPRKPSTKVSCRICKEVCTRKTIKTHRKLHILSALNWYHCQFCTKQSHKRANFVKHLEKKHYGVEMAIGSTLQYYSCDAEGCRHCFSSRSALEAHMQEKHGILHECSSCNKIFADQAHYETHQRKIHCTGDRIPMYACPYCHLNFEREKDVEFHQCAHLVNCVQSRKGLNDELAIGGYVVKKQIMGNHAFLPCPMCGRAFAQAAALRSHFDTHRPDNHGYPCKLCGRVLKTKIALYAHKNSAHNQWKCNFCQTVVKSQLTKRRHEFAYHKEEVLAANPFSCLRCLRHFPSQEQLDAHTQIHAESKCSICNVLCQNPKGKLVHERAHYLKRRDATDTEGPPKLSCLVCSKIFDNVELTKKHYQESHGKVYENITPIRRRPKKNNVKETLGEIEAKKKLRKTKEALEEFACEICGKVYKSQNGLNSHKYDHMEKNAGFTCDICGKHLKRPNSFHNHMWGHTKGNHGSNAVPCKYCGKNLSSRRSLRLHYFRDHKEDYLKETPFHCQVCYLAFKTEMERDEHYNTHMKCQFCERRCENKHKLTEHENSHTNSQPHCCEICGKRFNSDCNLRTHLVLHTGIRPHRCSICLPEANVGFMRKKQLGAHMEKCHPPTTSITSI